MYKKEKVIDLQQQLVKEIDSILRGDKGTKILVNNKSLEMNELMKHAMVEEPKQLEAKFNSNNLISHIQMEALIEQEKKNKPATDISTGAMSTLRDRKEDKVTINKVPILSIGGQSLKVDFDQKNTRGKSHDF